MKKKNVLAALLALVITLPVGAVPITVGGFDYSVEWAVGTFAEVDAAFGLMDEAWWGDDNLASGFALALGFQADGDGQNGFGPIFAFEYPAATMRWRGKSSRLDGTVSHWVGGSTGTLAFAYTIPSASVPEPASLGLIAIGIAGLGLSRKARQ